MARYLFSPPTRPDGAKYRANADPVVKGLWSHFRSHNKGISVVLRGDTFTEEEFVYGDDAIAADRFYQGGKIYELTAQEALDLTEAGYTITPAVFSKLGVLLRASQLPDGFVAGDDWPNLGTLGSAYDAFATGAPPLTVGPDPGFQLGISNLTHYSVPNGPEINSGRSFTLGVRLDMTHDGGVFEPILAKLTGVIGSGGRGIFLGLSTILGGTIGGFASGGLGLEESFAYAVDPAGIMTQGEHLVAMRYSIENDTIDLFLDNVKVDTLSPVNMDSWANTNPIIICRGTDIQQTHYDVFFAAEALTDEEITVEIPEALEVA